MAPPLLSMLRRNHDTLLQEKLMNNLQLSRKRTLILQAAIVASVLFSLNSVSYADCFLGICGGPTIIATPTIGKVGEAVGAVVGAPGRVVKEVGNGVNDLNGANRAQRDAEEKRKNAEHERQLRLQACNGSKTLNIHNLQAQIDINSALSSSSVASVKRSDELIKTLTEEILGQESLIKRTFYEENALQLCLNNQTTLSEFINELPSQAADVPLAVQKKIILETIDTALAQENENSNLAPLLEQLKILLSDGESETTAYKIAWLSTAQSSVQSFKTATQSLLSLLEEIKVEAKNHLDYLRSRVLNEQKNTNQEQANIQSRNTENQSLLVQVQKQTSRNCDSEVP